MKNISDLNTEFKMFLGVSGLLTIAPFAAVAGTMSDDVFNALTIVFTVASVIFAYKDMITTRNTVGRSANFLWSILGIVYPAVQSIKQKDWSYFTWAVLVYIISMFIGVIVFFFEKVL